MSSARAMRACMQVLVLLNLVFVQMTGAAGVRWLVPLLVLTLAAPLLERFRERRGYVFAWNAGAVGFLLVLARNGLQADLAYVRESGLVLAVLCQVHLLNNLRSSQRPDLLFFNAFLIAIITGFMTGFMNRSVGFPLAFLIFAAAYVVGLQLLSATRGGRVLAPTATRSLVVDGARRAGVVLVLSMLVFVLWPRDFERKPFFHGKLYMASDGPVQLDLGFNEELLLGRNQPVSGSNRPALRVTLLDGEVADVPTLWRGATLATTDGEGWRPMESRVRREAGPADELWRRWHARLIRTAPAAEDARTVRVEVVRYAQETERLFAPLGTWLLELSAGKRHRALLPRMDGTVDSAQTGDVQYELTLSPAVERPAGRTSADLPDPLLPYVQLPDDPRLASARELAARLAGRLPAEAEQHALVTLFSDHLARSASYLAPGADGAARSLTEFLAGEAGGHCEYFASALATMLRSRGVPCRVVTGFRGTGWEPDGRVLAIGTRAAHAWTEVFDPTVGWYAVDPSPLLVERDAGTGLLARLRSSLGSAWAAVTGFDAERRAGLLAWVRSLPARTARAFVRRPLGSALLLLLSLLPAAWLLHRRRTRTEPAVRAYRTAVRRIGMRPQPGETPRELMVRAAAQRLSGTDVRALRAATRLHEEARYARRLVSQ